MISSAPRAPATPTSAPQPECTRTPIAAGFMSMTPNEDSLSVLVIETFVGPRDSDAAITRTDRKSTRLNSSHQIISYAVFCLKKKKKKYDDGTDTITWMT